MGKNTSGSVYWQDAVAIHPAGGRVSRSSRDKSTSTGASLIAVVVGDSR